MRFLRFLLFSLLLLPTATAVAHGGGTLYVSNARVSDYLVSVWIAPAQLRTNEPVHFTVGVATAADRLPMLEADIEVAIYDVQSGERVAAGQPTTEQSVNRLFYEADMPALPRGNYQVEVTVAGPAGSDTVAFEISVVSYVNTSLIMAVLGGVLLLAAALWWRMWGQRNGRYRSRPHPRRRSRSATQNSQSVD